jgi:biotin operon repressor
MTYQNIIDSMPAGLDRCVLAILDKRRGIANAVKKGELTALARQMGFKVSNERQIRLAISHLRKQGVLIGSTNADGYFVCNSLEEWRYVKDTELLARVADITETVRIMDASAREAFGDGWQGRLI